MIIACPSCNTRFVVSPNAIPASGRNVRCARCKHQWFQSGEEVSRPDTVVLEPSVKQERPTRPAALPPPKKAAATPLWMKAAAASMALIFMSGAVVVFEKQLRGNGFEALYSLLGSPASDGITFSDLGILVLPGSEENSVKVSGKLYNGSQYERQLPTVKITLLDENHMPLETGNFNQENVKMAAGESVPFNIDMPSHSRRIEYVRLDVGNKLDLMMRE